MASRVNITAGTLRFLPLRFGAVIVPLTATLGPLLPGELLRTGGTAESVSWQSPFCLVLFSVLILVSQGIY